MKASIILELVEKFSGPARKAREALDKVSGGTANVTRKTQDLQRVKPAAVYQQMNRQAIRAGRSTSGLAGKERAIIGIKAQQIKQESRLLELAKKRVQAQDKLTQARAKMKQAAVTSAKVGGAGAAAVYGGQKAARGMFSMTNSVRPEEKARGELATMGIKNMAPIVNRAREMQNSVAGITSDVFLNAAYDIKSGISTLTDSGVAAQTASAGYVAKATKANISQMTSLFATGYGIYKQQFSKMSDADFGQKFGASLVGAVQTFKTDGAKMQQSIESAGSGAALLGQSMSETFTILGMLQQKMKAGEAGTGLRAFTEKAGEANVKFQALATKTDNPVVVRILDKNNMLRTMPKILQDVKARYGDTLDAMEQREIMSAFGSSEAVKVISSLWGSEKALAANTIQMDKLSKQGDNYSQSVAKIAGNNWDDKLILQQQRMAVLKMEISGHLIPVMDKLLPYFTAGINKVREFAAEHPNLIKYIGMAVMGLSALSVVGGGVLLTLAPMILSIAATRYALASMGVKGGMAGLMLKGLKGGAGVAGRAFMFLGGFALPMVGKALLFLGKALLLNPIGLAVGALVLGAVLVYKNWDKVQKWWSGTTWKQKALDIAGFLNPVGLAMKAGKGLWSWWSGTTWGKKSIELGTSGMSFAKLKGQELMTWWSGTSWGKKSIELGTSGMSFAKLKGQEMMSWWSGTSWGKKSIELGVKKINNAKQRVSNILSWWQGTSWEEKLLKLDSSAIGGVKTKVAGFGVWWRGLSLSNAVSVATSGLVKAKGKVTKFREWWNGLTLYDIGHGIGSMLGSKVVSMRKSWSGFKSWWNASTLQEKGVSIRSSAIDLTRNKVAKFKVWWGGISLKSLVPTMPKLNLKSNFKSFFSGLSAGWSESTKQADESRASAESVQSWWSSATWPKKAMTFGTSALDLARKKGDGLKAWWSTSKWGQKSLKVGASAVELAKKKAGAFFTMWSNGTLADKVAKVSSGWIDTAQLKIEKFQKFWNGLSLKSLMPNIKMPRFKMPWSSDSPAVAINAKAGAATSARTGKTAAPSKPYKAAGAYADVAMDQQAIIAKYGGARRTGGPVESDQFYKVNEDRPELITMGADTYLMNASGRVNPLSGRLPSQRAAANDRSQKASGIGRAGMMGAAALSVTLAMPLAAAQVPVAPALAQVAQVPTSTSSSTSSNAGSVVNHNESFTINITVEGGSNPAETGRATAKEIEKVIKQMQRRDKVRLNGAMHDGGDH